MGKQHKANELIEDFCKRDERLIYLDVVAAMLGGDGKPRQDLFQKDGLHLNAEGNKLSASLLKRWGNDWKVPQHDDRNPICSSGHPPAISVEDGSWPANGRIAVEGVQESTAYGTAFASLIFSIPDGKLSVYSRIS